MLAHNPEIETIIAKASEYAKELNHEYVTVEHLLLALITYNNFETMLREFGAEYDNKQIDSLHVGSATKHNLCKGSVKHTL